VSGFWNEFGGGEATTTDVCAFSFLQQLFSFQAEAQAHALMMVLPKMHHQQLPQTLTLCPPPQAKSCAPLFPLHFSISILIWTPLAQQHLGMATTAAGVCYSLLLEIETSIGGRETIHIINHTMEIPFKNNTGTWNPPPIDI
jgi:hypothetical protein